MMRVLIACEFSGIVRDAFATRGHDAMSCDLLPSERPGKHYQGDVLDILEDGWDLMIAHPPCTYLANSGVQHLHKDPDRWEKMVAAGEFFMTLLDAPISKIAVENPVPHHYANLPKYTQIIQPYQFGHNVQKRTCLWLKCLPMLVTTKVVDKGECYMGRDGKSNGSKWYQLPPSIDRWRFRSRTFQGIANAMAEQWGCNTEPIQTKL
jgi:hypothetical protein